MTALSFDAQPTAALFDRQGAVFALGDGSVRFASGERTEAHDGAVLCAAVHPSGDGIVTGGDDGKLVWTRRDAAAVLATVKGWVDAVATAPATGLIAFSSGRTASVLDIKDDLFRRDFAHERTVAALAFDPKGRRLAAATYGGAALWFARIDSQKPTMMKWAGSHTAVAFAPDGRFLFTAMQDNQLHGWRLSDAKDMRMGGYPARIRDMSFLAKGRLMATSGAHGGVLWPLSGANGPMGQSAIEIGREGYDTVVTTVASSPAHGHLAAGLADGRVWLAEPAGDRLNWLSEDRGAPVVALSMNADASSVCWAREDGEAGVVEV